jgi:hypothetical protein
MGRRRRCRDVGLIDWLISGSGFDCAYILNRSFYLSFTCTFGGDDSLLWDLGCGSTTWDK